MGWVSLCLLAPVLLLGISHPVCAASLQYPFLKQIPAIDIRNQFSSRRTRVVMWDGCICPPAPLCLIPATASDELLLPLPLPVLSWPIWLFPLIYWYRFFQAVISLLCSAQI